jgi:hypothetical protein
MRAVLAWEDAGESPWAEIVRTRGGLPGRVRGCGGGGGEGGGLVGGRVLVSVSVSVCFRVSVLCLCPVARVPFFSRHAQITHTHLTP